MGRVYLIFERDSDVSNCGRGTFIGNPDFSDGWESRYLEGVKKPDRVQAFSLDGATAAGNLFYNEELANIDGMSFMLIQEPTDSDEAVKEAKAWLRHTRDVVRIQVLRLTEVVDWKGVPLC